MNCLAAIVKYILYLFNLIFVLCGILLIVFGSIMLSNTGHIASFSEVINTRTLPVLIILLGCIIFIISFLGCCGAIRESVCCISAYSVFMFVLLCLQVALIVWIFVKRQDFLKAMGEVVDHMWYKNDQANGYPMNALQLSFKCCGRESYQDYLNVGHAVPKSCCGSISQAGPCEAAVYETKPGCRAQVVDFWTSNMNIAAYAGIGVALVELVALIFSCYLTGNIRKSQIESI